jgi:hypothetical protein
MVDTLASAKAYAHAGLSVIPVRTDGTKAPALTTWKRYQEEAANDDQLDRWFAGTTNGVAIVWGNVSGNGEVIDFDEPGLYDLFAQECSDQGLSSVVEGMPLIETPSGGRHLIYRCIDRVEGNQKLAQRQIGDGVVETLIETRGDGGYTIAPGSPEACHPDGRPYRFLRGQSLKIPVISTAERSALLSIAASFNEYVKPSSIRGSDRLPRTNSAQRPGDDYNRRGDIDALLTKHGWTPVGKRGETGLWRRPGKDGPGVSATSNHAGTGLFYVFSTSADPFDARTAYPPFSVFALLEHGGDYKAAAAALAAEGYGEQPAPHLASATTAAVSPERKPFAARVIDLADVDAPPDDLPYLFGPYILKGACHWVTGTTGIGKSTLAYNIACALIEGETLWDIECRPCGVLYIDLESGDIGRRLKVHRLYRDRSRPRGRLHFVSDAVALPGEVDDILKYVAEHNIELVIFDTARRCFSVRDENDNAEFYARIVPTLDAFKQAGIATLTFGHPAKHDVGRARGAGAQEDAGDVNLSLTLYSGDIGSPEATILLKATKNRILGLGTPHLYLRRAGNDRFVRVERPADGNDRKEHPPSISAKVRCAADVKAHLQARSGDRLRRTALDEALKPLGHSESTINRTLREMLGQGLIDKDAAGYVWLDGST